MTISDSPRGKSRAARWRPWEIAFVLALGGAIIITVYIAARRLYLGFDDLVTAVIVSDPSLPHMIKAILHGVEVNPPLFFMLEWMLSRLTGHGDFGLRLISAVSLALAVPVLYATLRRIVRPEAAALAVAFVIGLSRGAYEYATYARYYALMILLAALAAYLFAKLYATGGTRRDYLCVFTVHTAMIYTHLFGFFFSGGLLVSHLLLDGFNRTFRWRLYAAVISAWATFALWAPALPRQLSVTKDGTYTPRLDVGTFFEALEMQTPLGVILLLIALLVVVNWLSTRAAGGPQEVRVPDEPAILLRLATLALAWMAIPVATWAASHVVKPFFMPRYAAPCLIAWVILFAALLSAVFRFPSAGAPARFSLPPWCPRIVWLAVLGACIMWQPLRAWTEPPKGQPFHDYDYGHVSLPIVFEDPMDLLPRVIYGTGREYVLLLDREAAKADPNYYTKLTVNYFERWRSFYPNIRVLYYDELPAWPEGYLAVDGELAKTFDWLFKSKTDMKVELLGPSESGNNVYRVQTLR